MCRLQDAVVVAPQLIAVLPQDVIFMLIACRVSACADVTGVGIFSDQLERYLLAATAYPDGDVGLLHALRLVDSATHLVILTLECGIRLGPHGADNLEGFV